MININILLTIISKNGDYSSLLIYNPYNSSEDYIEKNNLISFQFHRNEMKCREISKYFRLIRLENWKTIVNYHRHIISARNMV